MKVKEVERIVLVGNAIFLFYAALTTVVPALVIYQVFRLRGNPKDEGSHAQGEGFLGLLVFALYTGTVFFNAGVSTLYELFQYGFQHHPEQINLVPFYEGRVTVQYVLNIIMFMPFGILLPLVWPQVNKLRFVLGYSLGFSVFIELSQMFNNRITDIDDLIMNILGALLGFILLTLVRRLGKPVPRKERSTGSAWRPAVYLAGMALGWFFLFYHKGLVELLYGQRPKLF